MAKKQKLTKQKLRQRNVGYIPSIPSASSAPSKNTSIRDDDTVSKENREKEELMEDIIDSLEPAKAQDDDDDDDDSSDDDSVMEEITSSKSRAQALDQLQAEEKGAAAAAA